VQELAHILEGTADAQTLAALRAGITTWLRSATRGKTGIDGRLQKQRQISLNQCLHLPASPERTRIALRNHYLREAAQKLSVPAECPWVLARALHREAQLFAGHQWHCWIGLDAAPSHASPVNALLFHAMRWGGGRLPRSEKSYYLILES
jgi:hypothetical protein